MEFKSIIDSVNKIRQELQEKRRNRNNSRSISPLGSQLLNLSLVKDENNCSSNPNFKQKHSIPINREKLLEKYSPLKCPLSKSKNKPKTYQLDAGELIVFSIQQFIKRIFLEIKHTRPNKRNFRKSEINIMVRDKSISKLKERRSNCFHEKANTTQYIPWIREKATKNKYLSPTAQLAKFLNSKIIKEKKIFFWAFKIFANKISMVSPLQIIKRIIKAKLKTIFKFLIENNDSKLNFSNSFLSNNTNQIRYSTPKPKECNNSKDALIDKNNSFSTVSKLKNKLTPGKIFRVPVNKFIDIKKNREKQQKERKLAENIEFDMEIYPTFGPEIREFAQKNERIQENKTQNDVDDTLKTYNNNKTTLPSEELTQKSFNQNTRYSSFDKEYSTIRNSKEESFDWKFKKTANFETEKPDKRYFNDISISPTFKIQEKLCRTGKTLTSQQNFIIPNINSSKRKIFIMRLETLSKFEDKFYQRDYRNLIYFINRIKIFKFLDIFTIILTTKQKTAFLNIKSFI